MRIEIEWQDQFGRWHSISRRFPNTDKSYIITGDNQIAEPQGRGLVVNRRVNKDLLGRVQSTEE
jgi:hypothetical protein